MIVIAARIIESRFFFDFGLRESGLTPTASIAVIEIIFSKSLILFCSSLMAG
jgi:hypothetical protein